MQSMNKNLQMFPREVFSNLSQGMSASALADTIGQYINVESVSYTPLDVYKRQV